MRNRRKLKPLAYLIIVILTVAIPVSIASCVMDSSKDNGSHKKAKPKKTESKKESDNSGVYMGSDGMPTIMPYDAETGEMNYLEY